VLLSFTLVMLVMLVMVVVMVVVLGDGHVLLQP
jgi:hypothetical protein